MNTQKLLTAATLCAFITACGGGGGSTPPTGSGTLPTGPTTLALKFTFNTKSTAVVHRRRANYVSYSTHGLGIDVVSHIGDAVLPKNLAGMRSPAFATTIAAGYSGTNTTCTALGGGGNPAGVYSCVLLVAAPSGYDDVQITTWDQTPSANGFGGTFAGSANNLSTNFLPNQLVLANQTNNFDFALDGVVASVALQVSPITLVAGAPLGQAPNPAAITLTVKAIDAQGNTIVGSDPYVDANGNAVTINVSKTESYPTPVPSPTTGPVVGPTAPPGGDLTITTVAFTSPSATTSAVTYNGYDIASVLFNATVTENAGGLDVTGPVSKATLNFTQSTNGGINVPSQPAITYYASAAVPVGALPSAWGYLAVGPDGNLYATQGAAHTIIQVNPANGAVLNTYNVGAAVPTAIVMGSDNALYFVDTAPGVGAFNIDRFTAAGVVTNAYATTASDVRAMVLGNDGNIWFTDLANDRVGELNIGATATGSVNYRSLTAGARPTGIASGSDGRIWVTEYNNGKVAAVTTDGAMTLTEYVLPGVTTANGIYGITAGPDGNLWAVENFTNNVDRITTAGALSSQIATSGVSGANFITTGPDGDLWFTGRGANVIGRITPAGLFTQVTTGVTDGSFQIAPGAPGGKVWFGTYNTQELGSATP